MSSRLETAAVTFEQELPSLLQTHSQQWVIYYGDQRIAIGDDPDELVASCEERGYSLKDLYVCKIQPAIPPARQTW